MKWRVERPDRYDGHFHLQVSVGPDIVEADLAGVAEGCLKFHNLDAGGLYIKLYAPGQWVTVERVEDE